MLLEHFLWGLPSSEKPIHRCKFSSTRFQDFSDCAVYALVLTSLLDLKFRQSCVLIVHGRANSAHTPDGFPDAHDTSTSLNTTIPTGLSQRTPRSRSTGLVGAKLHGQNNQPPRAAPSPNRQVTNKMIPSQEIMIRQQVRNQKTRSLPCRRRPPCRSGDRCHSPPRTARPIPTPPHEPHLCVSANA